MGVILADLLHISPEPTFLKLQGWENFFWLNHRVVNRKGPSDSYNLVSLLKDADFLGTELRLKYLKLFFPLLATYQVLSVDMLAVPNAQSWLLLFCVSDQVNLFIPRYVNYVYDFQIYICKLQTHVSNCLLTIYPWVSCRYSQINVPKTRLSVVQLVYPLQLHITHLTRPASIACVDYPSCSCRLF